MSNNKWLTALYARVSEQDINSEQNSITNQIHILNEVSLKKGLIIQKEYIDNGKSGGSFDRPAFNEMISDIEKGRINCVLVKDLSRFGREHIDANYFIEKFFPRMGVRIITAIEGFDSFEDKDRMTGIEVPIINLFNDQYLQEVSNSTKANMKVAMTEGKFIRAREPYAYLRSPENKHKLIVDTKVAENVRRIFRWYIDGASFTGIATRLNTLGVESPSAWRAALYEKSIPDPQWRRHHIITILKDEVYIGDMVQGKTTSPNRKVKTRMNVPMEQWITVKNTHAPIITRKDFFIVQEMLKLQAKPHKTHSSTNKSSLFSGKTFCQDCEKPLKRQIKQGVRPPHDMRYFCSTYLKLGKDYCSSHYILETDLYDAVAQEIKRMLMSLDHAVSSTLDGERRGKLIQAMGFKAERLTHECNKNKRLKNELYIDLKRGIINEIEFCDLKMMFDKRILKAQEERDSIEKELQRIREGKSADPIIRSILSYIGFEKLTRAMIIELVDRITVDHDRLVRVVFKHKENIQKYL